MFYAIAVVLVVLWILGLAVFHLAGGFIHVLLLLAAISAVWQFTSRRITA